MRNRGRSKPGRFETLAPEQEKRTPLYKGVFFFSKAYTFKDKNKTYLNNIYGVEIDCSQEELKFDMLTSMRGKFPRMLISDAINKGIQTIAGINTNFFYLVDETKFQPKDYSYNLNICNGVLYQLPNADKTALLIDKKGSLKCSFVRARGSLIIGGMKINWVGSKSKSLTAAKNPFGIIYNTANLGITQITDVVTGTKRIPDPLRSQTPFIKGRMDLVMNTVNSRLVVTSRTNGGTHFFKGNFIISVPKSIGQKIGLGSELTSCQIDGFSLDELKAAVTMGVNIPKTKNSLISQIKREATIIAYRQNGDPLFHKSARFSRSIVFKTKNKIIFMIIDSRPKIDTQQGMTLFDLQRCIYSLYPDIVWAVNCDGGHTSKLVMTKDKKIEVFGNLHYKIWPKTPNENFVWDGKNGRKVPSLLIVKKWS